MTIPLELKLLATTEGPRMTWTPIKELESLRKSSYRRAPITLEPQSANPFAHVKAELVELHAEFSGGESSEVEFNIRGASVVYDFKKQELSVNNHRAAAPPRDGKQRLTIYCDRTGLEVFASDGLTYVPMPYQPKPDDRSLRVTARDGSVRFTDLQVHELKSAWPAPQIVPPAR